MPGMWQLGLSGSVFDRQDPVHPQDLLSRSGPRLFANAFTYAWTDTYRSWCSRIDCELWTDSPPMMSVSHGPRARQLRGSLCSPVLRLVSCDVRNGRAAPSVMVSRVWLPPGGDSPPFECDAGVMVG